MPCRKTHQVAGSLAGALWAFARSKEEPDDARLLETFGGLAAGYVGGRLPDILEPALTPRHRSICHSELAGFSCVEVGRKTLLNWERWCRQQSVRLADEANQLRPDNFWTFVKRLLSMVFRILAGALSGFLAGYGSHLALDAMTPASIGLLGILVNRRRSCLI